jgi:hypothetical protein
MRRHLQEIENSLAEPTASPANSLRDLFAPYRETRPVS